MSGYEIDLPKVGRVITTLEEGADQVRAANAELGGYSGGDVPGGFSRMVADAGGALESRMGVLGNEALASSAGRFGDKWRYGLGKLDESAEQVIEGLSEAKQLYEEVEQAVSDLFDAFLADVPAGPTDCGWDNAATHGSSISDALGGGQ